MRTTLNCAIDWKNFNVVLSGINSQKALIHYILQEIHLKNAFGSMNRKPKFLDNMQERIETDGNPALFIQCIGEDGLWEALDIFLMKFNVSRKEIKACGTISRSINLELEQEQLQFLPSMQVESAQRTNELCASTSGFSTLTFSTPKTIMAQGEPERVSATCHKIT